MIILSEAKVDVLNLGEYKSFHIFFPENLTYTKKLIVFTFPFDGENSNLYVLERGQQILKDLFSCCGVKEILVCGKCLCVKADKEYAERIQKILKSHGIKIVS